MARPTTADDPILKEYARLAARYDRRWAFYVETTIQQTLVRTQPRPGDRLLDVGCGTGALLYAFSLASPEAELVGIDLSAEMLEVARAKLGSSIELRQGRAESLPFDDESFDLVVSTSVLHYLRRPEAGLAEARRVLKPGGAVVVTDWCDDYLACRLFDPILRVLNRAHFRTYGRDDCARLVEEAAFVEIEVERYKIDWFWGLMTARAKKPA